MKLLKCILNTNVTRLKYCVQAFLDVEFLKLALYMLDVVASFDLLAKRTDIANPDGSSLEVLYCNSYEE